MEHSYGQMDMTFQLYVNFVSFMQNTQQSNAFKFICKHNLDDTLRC